MKEIEQIKEELKVIFKGNIDINMPKYNARDIFGDVHITNQKVDSKIDKLEMYTIKELTDKNNRKKIADKRGVYFVCKNIKNIGNYISYNGIVNQDNKKNFNWYKKEALEETIKYIGETNILYIGKAGGEKNKLRQRIGQYINFGRGTGNNHAGGRTIWEFSNADNFIFCWVPIENAESAEKMLIENYKLNQVYKKYKNKVAKKELKKYRPLANRKNGG